MHAGTHINTFWRGGVTAAGGLIRTPGRVKKKERRWEIHGCVAVFVFFTKRLICCLEKNMRWGMERGSSLQRKRRCWCCVWLILIFLCLKRWSVWGAPSWHLQRVLPHFPLPYLYSTPGHFLFRCLFYCNSRASTCTVIFWPRLFSVWSFSGKAASRLSFSTSANYWTQRPGVSRSQGCGRKKEWNINKWCTLDRSVK